VTRWRRPGADQLLLVYLVLVAASGTLGWLSHAPRAQDQLGSLLFAAFLTWRVSRGGWISHSLLLISSAVSYGTAALSLARSWDRPVLGLLFLGAAQLALLLSPAVYLRSRCQQADGILSDDGWAQLLWRPPTWLLPWALLGGGVITLACLGHMDWGPAAGCHPAASPGCSALSEGYPLRWLTADQNVPVISKRALLRDFAQWTVVSGSVLYLGWLPVAGRPGRL